MLTCGEKVLVSVSSDVVPDSSAFRAILPDFLHYHGKKVCSLDVCAARLVYYAKQAKAFQKQRRVLCLDAGDGKLITHLLDELLALEKVVVCSPNKAVARNLETTFSCGGRLSVFDGYWPHVLASGVLEPQSFDLIVMIGGLYGEASTGQLWKIYQNMLVPLLSSHGVAIFDRYLPQERGFRQFSNMEFSYQDSHVDTSLFWNDVSYHSRRHLFPVKEMYAFWHSNRRVLQKLDHTLRPCASHHPIFFGQREEWWMTQPRS